MRRNKPAFFSDRAPAEFARKAQLIGAEQVKAVPAARLPLDQRAVRVMVGLRSRSGGWWLR